ncbi:heavy metal-binding domain-containing protein [Flavobacterium sp. 83]|jgi:hypothetical protein|uniref:heavy metal-binding domain-containing protein n=1 Tax=Flavobacterium sp. 83 TaxID=1131812 RepID=UPI000A4E115E|nr:heavy metal-binding domain-containing protein [Flavobacterium sp. 83]
MSFIMVSCNQKNKETPTNDSHMMDNNSTMMNSDSTMMRNDSTMMGNNTKMMKNNQTMYACPMHPEVQGKLNDKCPKCGMKLTKPVAETPEKSNK